MFFIDDATSGAPIQPELDDAFADLPAGGESGSDEESHSEAEDHPPESHDTDDDDEEKEVDEEKVASTSTLPPPKARKAPAAWIEASARTLAAEAKGTSSSSVPSLTSLSNAGNFVLPAAV